MAELKKITNEALYRAAALAEGYESVPVSIDQFINDPYYLGQTYGEGRVYPYWMERLHEIYPNPLYSPVQEALITGCIGAGKDLCVKTRVITEQGYKPAGEIELSDRLLGTDGKFHKLLGIYPQGRRHCWKLKFSDDSEVVAGDGHIWTVTTKYEGSGGWWWSDMTTADIVASGKIRGLPKLRFNPCFSEKVLESDPSLRDGCQKSRKSIVGWEDAGEHESVCFMVDSPDHLFAIENFTFTHNTTVAIIGLLYDLYHVVLLKDPHKKYKLIPTTPIVISLITATMDLAGAVMANQLLDVIGASPFFMSKLNPRKGEHLDEDMFPHHVGIAYGSRGGHSLGKAVIGAIIDEANFQNAVADQAIQNYNTIKRRMQSRFMQKGGVLPCRMWIVSSRNEGASFLESHIDAKRGHPGIFIAEPAIWEVQAHKGIYSGKTFPVFTGTLTEQPRILTTDEEVESYAGYVTQVPVEYREQFEDNLPGALQDLAGVATRNGVNLIYNVEKLEAAMCLDNCMSSDELHITLTGEDQIMQYYTKPLPPGQYYVHLDGAKSGDRYGFAMSRVTEQISVTQSSAMTGEEVSKISPMVETPLCFGIKALPGSEVPLWKVRQFLVDLRAQHVNIAYVSFDGYQSMDMAQLLVKLGFNSGYASVDRTKDAYLKLASNISLGLHKMPKSPILRTELINLQNLPKKIDHPLTVMVDGKQVKGGKDIADAVTASAFNAINASMTLTQSNMIEQMKKTPLQMSIKDRQDYVISKIFG